MLNGKDGGGVMQGLSKEVRFIITVLAFAVQIDGGVTNSILVMLIVFCGNDTKIRKEKEKRKRRKSRSVSGATDTA